MLGGWALVGKWVCWVDVADSQPCIGTGGIVAWSLKVCVLSGVY